MKEKTIISWPQSGRTGLITMIGKVFYEYSGECDLATKFSDYFGRDIKNLGEYNLHTFPREHEDQAGLKTAEELNDNKYYLNDMYKKGRSLPSDIFDVIFLVRHPRDAIVSNYIRRTKIQNPNVRFDGTISEFIRSRKGSLKTMISGLNIGANQKHKMRNYYLVRYEDLHLYGYEELRNIIDFIGYSNIPDNIIEDAVDFASFDNMKQMEQQEGNKHHIMFDKTKNFVREGKFGKGKDYFNKEDNDYITSHIESLNPIYGYEAYGIKNRTE